MVGSTESKRPKKNLYWIKVELDDPSIRQFKKVVTAPLETRCFLFLPVYMFCPNFVPH